MKLQVHLPHLQPALGHPPQKGEWYPKAQKIFLGIWKTGFVTSSLWLRTNYFLSLENDTSKQPALLHDVEHSFQLDTGASSKDPLKDSSPEKKSQGERVHSGLPNSQCPIRKAREEPEVRYNTETQHGVHRVTCI